MSSYIIYNSGTLCECDKFSVNKNRSKLKMVSLFRMEIHRSRILILKSFILYHSIHVERISNNYRLSSIAVCFSLLILFAFV